MTWPLPRVAQRLLAVGLLLVVVVIIHVGLVTPVIRYHAGLQAHGEQTAQRLDRYRRIVARAETPAAAAAAPDVPLGEIYLPGNSQAQAAAALQERVKTATALAGARLGSVEALPPRDAGGLTLQTVRARLSADTQSLQKLLHTLEAGRPIVLLDNLYTRARDVRSDKSRLRLDVRFDAVGVVGQAVAP